MKIISFKRKTSSSDKIKKEIADRILAKKIAEMTSEVISSNDDLYRAAIKHLKLCREQSKDGGAEYEIKYKINNRVQNYVRSTRTDVVDHIKEAREQERAERRDRKSKGIHRIDRRVGGERIAMTYFGSRRFGYVREEKGYFMHLRKRLTARECFKAKQPLNANKHVGIELEVCTKVPAKEVALALAAQNMQQHVEIKEDGSLRSKKGDYTMEICILAEETNFVAVVRVICAVLNSKEIGAYVNETCGYHVHIDMRSRKANEAYKKLFKAQKFLIETQPPCRMDSNFCKESIETNFERAMASNRYSVVNACSVPRHNTIEVRSHSGTSDYNKIVNWVKLMIAIVDGKDTDSWDKYKKWSTLEERTGLDEAVIQFYKDRMEKFVKFYNDNENTDMSIMKMPDLDGQETNTRRYIENKTSITKEELKELKTKARTVGWSTGMGDRNIA